MSTTVYGREVGRYGWRARVAHWLLTAGCRHLEGTVCEHRQFEHDIWQRGYGDGLTAGRSNMEAKWRGNVYGSGPYAGYPAPARGPENVR